MKLYIAVVNVCECDFVLNSRRVLQEKSAALRRGGVVAIPTDTIYGVASLVSSNEGIERIYDMERQAPGNLCQ